MRWGRFFFVGLVALGWAGCAAVTGLDDYEISAGSPDAVDAGAEATMAVPDATPNDAAAEAEASTPDTGPTPPIDAGPCGACLSGTARMLCVMSACSETRRVFVTHGGFVPNQGLTAADAMCQASADAASLHGSWKAWLSTGTSPVKTRFAIAAVPYRLLDGTEIVAAGANLFGGTILHAIDLDETGASMTAAAEKEVWTGTKVSGDGTDDCKDWTLNNNATVGEVGLLDQSGSSWTAVYIQSCDRTGQHLYCFEQ